MRRRRILWWIAVLVFLAVSYWSLDPRQQGAKWPETPFPDPETFPNATYAIATLLMSVDYEATVMQLCFSIRDKKVPSDVHLVVLALNGMDTRHMSCCFDRIIMIENVKVHPYKQLYANVGRLDTQYNKLLAWTLVDYRRVILMDGDTTVVNTQALMDLVHSPIKFAAVQGQYGGEYSTVYNSGFIVTEPSTAEFARLLNLAQDFVQEPLNGEISEQNFITNVFQGNLPQRFNIEMGLKRESNRRWKIERDRAVMFHFNVGKPWHGFAWFYPYSQWVKMDARARSTCGHPRAVMSWWNSVECFGTLMDWLRWIPYRID